MKRRFIISDDVSPVNVSVSFITTATSGTHTVDTGSMVKWAIISNSNINSNLINVNDGPYFFDAADASGGPIYDIRHSDITNDIAAEYSENSLQLFLNGQQLTRDVDYQEILDGSVYHRFELIDVGTTGLPEYPDSGDQLSIYFEIPQSLTSLSGNEFIEISTIYPDVSTGFIISYTNFGVGETINLNIVYR